MLTEKQIEKIREIARMDGEVYAEDGVELDCFEYTTWMDVLNKYLREREIAEEFGLAISEQGETNLDEWKQFLDIYEAECQAAYDEARDEKYETRRFT